MVIAVQRENNIELLAWKNVVTGATGMQKTTPNLTGVRIRKDEEEVYSGINARDTLEMTNAVVIGGLELVALLILVRADPLHPVGGQILAFTA